MFAAHCLLLNADMCKETIRANRISPRVLIIRSCPRGILFASAVATFLISVGCVTNPPANNSTPHAPVATTNTATNSIQTEVENKSAAYEAPVTLPLLDAMFADASFASDLKSKVGLSDDQINQIQQAARNAVLKLSESDVKANSSSTRAASRQASTQIKNILGDEKTKQLFDFVRQRWAGSDQDALLSGRPNAVPTDTRIVVNAPAYRMDVFRDGRLEKTYRVGIGYPEFPLPRGLRKATTIVFNPEWTPPDEPWVKGKFEPGKKVDAGSKDNPLGPIKIPIGLPSLIHGGKRPARLGTFASHGCVGLTNQQVETFAQELAALAGSHLTLSDIKAYQKDKSKTQELKLQNPVPIELRYETIVVEDGKLHIYRDVYELGTNTEETLRKVLSAYDVDFDNLDQNAKTTILDALRSMSFDAQGHPVFPNDTNHSRSKSLSNTGNVTRTIKGDKEVVVALPQLAGKGYPAPVNLMG